MRQLIVLAVLAGCTAANAAALTPSQVFDKVKDSVVVVKTFNAKGKNISLGSGVLLPSGKIGTNCHVVENGATFQVGGSKKFISATLWGGDEDKDICLLEASGLTAKPARLGQASRLKVGEPVYAIGAPQGLELSLSNGIVSQLRGGPPPFIQTTAAISHGSSGGGLFDAEGRLVGFTTLYIEGGQSLNFAMPVEWVGEIQAGMKAALAGSTAPKAGQNFRDCPRCPTMVVIPSGSFDMGSNKSINDYGFVPDPLFATPDKGSNNDDENEKPVHRVTFAQPFALGKTAVTQAQWRAVMGNKPSYFSRCGDNCPVERVSWYDAQVFIQKLNTKTGKKYRLPSEAEWEYACRAGGKQEYCGSDNIDSVAWHSENSGFTTHPVASKQANAFGLYDMSGNVEEWVEDSYHNNYIGAPVDGSAWRGDDTNRVKRGNSAILTFEWNAHATLRSWGDPAIGNNMNGFRLARTLP